MDLSKRKINPKRREQGAWVKDIPDWEDLELKVRGAGNADYKRMQAKLFEEVPREKRIRGRVEPEERDRIVSTCLLETVLLDWRNLKENGAAVSYSKEAARRYLFEPEFEDFRAIVAWAAGIVADEGEASVEDALGNSEPASAGQ